jgi:hypothetical protein
MTAVPSSLPCARRLSELYCVQPDTFHQALLDVATPTAAGPPAVRQRMLAEARDLVVLAQVSRRLDVRWIDLAAGLRAKVDMEVPVPCLPDPAGPLQIAPRAVLGFQYPPQALVMPQPGYAFVSILAPRPVWLSNASADASQALCLGARLPPGIPLREIVLMTYGALTLQTVQMDLLDAAGVLNPAAALWWQQNTHRIPLTREPFLREEANHVP